MFCSIQQHFSTKFDRMNLLVFSLLIICSTTKGVKNSDGEKKKLQQKVAGSISATRGQFPYHVAIIGTDHIFVGSGNLIATTWVLTVSQGIFPQVKQTIKLI